jgi:hypothetical protein
METTARLMDDGKVLESVNVWVSTNLLAREHAMLSCTPTEEE